jgi:hypothetical protein
LTIFIKILALVFVMKTLKEKYVLALFLGLLSSALVYGTSAPWPMFHTCAKKVPCKASGCKGSKYPCAQTPCKGSNCEGSKYPCTQNPFTSLGCKGKGYPYAKKAPCKGSDCKGSPYGRSYNRGVSVPGKDPKCCPYGKAPWHNPLNEK